MTTCHPEPAKRGEGPPASGADCASRAGSFAVYAAQDDRASAPPTPSSSPAAAKIGFETALAFARETGTKLILLGRSKDDDELRANFARLDAANIRYEYIVADVTKPLARTFENVTAILHAAARTRRRSSTDGRGPVPQATARSSTDSRTCRRGQGTRCSSSSPSARSSPHRHARRSAFANEWLARRRRSSATRIELRAMHRYSVWSGMGWERLGTVDMLRRQAAIAPTRAAALQLAAARRAHVMACGRADPPTLRFDVGETPLLRFLEQMRVIPGVELIADAGL
jgi:enediyne polyketide synthase